MNTRLTSTELNASLLRFGLLVVLLASCAPSTAPTEAEATQVVIQPAPVEPTLGPPQPFVVEPTATRSPILEASPLPVATSRGPNLEATDPLTVSLASEQLQFVEFFRFT